MSDTEAKFYVAEFPLSIPDGRGSLIEFEPGVPRQLPARMVEEATARGAKEVPAGKGK